MWCQIFFYSISIFAIFVFLGLEPFSVKGLLSHLAPVIFGRWWFASTYILLYLFSPYINKLLRLFDNRQYIGFLALLISCWCLVPTFTGEIFGSNSLLWFVLVYSLGGYIQLHGFLSNLSAIKSIGISIGLAILTFLSTIIFDVIGTKIPFVAKNAMFLFGERTLTVLMNSLFLFLGFTKIRIKNSIVINTISSATFGIYLIHDDEYVRQLLWKTICKNATYADNYILIPYSLLVVLIVFIGCAIIDFLRQYVIEKPCIGVIVNISNHIDKKNSLFIAKLAKQFVG